MRTTYGHLEVDLSPTATPIGHQHPDLPPDIAAQLEARRLHICASSGRGHQRQKLDLASEVFDQIRAVEALVPTRDVVIRQADFSTAVQTLKLLRTLDSGSTWVRLQLTDAQIEQLSAAGVKISS